MVEKRVYILFHVIVMYIIFIIGDWIRMFAFKFDIEAPYDEMLSVCIDISVVLLLVWLYTKLILKSSLKEFMICHPLPESRWCFISVIIPLMICIFYLYFIKGELRINNLNHDEIIYVFSYTIFRAGICAGVVEEIIFRGMIMNLLKSSFGKTQSILLSSVVFATIHLGNTDTSHISDTMLVLFSTTLAGVALACVAYETGSVWSGAVIHGMYNVIIGGQLFEISTEHYFTTFCDYTIYTGNSLFTGKSYGITAAVPTMIGFFLIILLTKKTKQFENKKNIRLFFLFTTLLVFGLGININKMHGKSIHINDEIAIETTNHALSQDSINMIKKSERYKLIIQQQYYPIRMIEDLERNPEIIDFVEQYGKDKAQENAVLTNTEKNEEFPLFIQWDSRWGYKPYGNNMIGLSGCGPTCLSMVVYSLTRDQSITPDFVADYSMKNGYYVDGVGTSWDLMVDFPNRYGITVQSTEYLQQEEIENYLRNGCIIICSVGPGDFTDQGHFIVLRGANNNGFIINDPFSYTNSSHEWNYEQLQPQICQMWIYKLE